MRYDSIDGVTAIGDNFRCIGGKRIRTPPFFSSSVLGSNSTHLLARAARPWPAVVVTLACVFGCGSEVSCPGVLSAAVTVTVVGSTDSAVCDVTVHIVGNQVDVQRDLTPDTCSAFAGQEAGVYEVSVLRAGSELTRQQVRASSGECGVVTENVVVRLPAR